MPTKLPPDSMCSACSSTGSLTEVCRVHGEPIHRCVKCTHASIFRSLHVFENGVKKGEIARAVKEKMTLMAISRVWLAPIAIVSPLAIDIANSDKTLLKQKKQFIDELYDIVASFCIEYRTIEGVSDCDTAVFVYDSASNSIVAVVFGRLDGHTRDKLWEAIPLCFKEYGYTFETYEAAFLEANEAL